jgi:uncharacterized membrane protein YfcA
MSLGYWYLFPVSIGVATLAMFTVPGVLIGGQLGPRVQARVNPDKMKVLISWIFMGVGAFMLSTLLGA